MTVSSACLCRSRLKPLILGFSSVFLVLYLYRGGALDLTENKLLKFCVNSSDRTLPNATLQVLTNIQRQYSESMNYAKVETDVFKDRGALIRNICIESYENPHWKELSPTGETWTFLPLDLHVCMVPKVGCTYWKQVLRFISGDIPSRKNITKPSEVDRTFVHYGGLSRIWATKLKHPVTRMLVSSGNSFMFARNPYTRLWSAYIDKAFLPDFWRTSIRPIMKLMRPWVNEEQIYCPHNITFEEFLTYITKIYPNTLNEHWQPIYKICSPCQVNYKFIGKLETFGSDTKAILNDIGLGSLTENTSKSYRDMAEIEMLTEYNFRLENTVPPGCLNKEEIARRLWKAFQYNGYIHKDFDVPLAGMHKDNFTSRPVEVFVKHALWTMKYQADQQIDVKNQKHVMMMKAYQKVPSQVMEDIKRIYEYDFILFGYNITLS